VPVLVQTNYRPQGDGIAGALNGLNVAVGIGQTMQVNLQDASHASNSANNKWPGRRVFVVDRNVIVTATGGASTSAWLGPDGVYEIVPV